LLEQSRSRGGAIVFGAIGALLAAYLAWLLVRGPQALQLGVTNGWVGTGFRLAAGVVCLVFGLRQRRGSYVPLVFGVALIFTAIGNTILTLDSLHGPPPPPPTPADYFLLGFIVLCFAGIGLMAREDRQRLSPRELLDGGIAALGAGAVGAGFALAHVARIPGESSVGAAFQLGDAIGFVVLVLLVVGAAAVAAGQSRLPWVALTTAFALLAVGSGLGAALGMTVAVRTLTEIQWPVATLLIAAAICADPGVSDPLAVRRGVAVWIPALACGAAIAVLFAATLTAVNHTATALAASALLLVLVRGYSELRHEIGTRERTERSLRVSEVGYRRVADEQAALRRVATLVAEAAPPPAVFASVAEEVGRLLVVDAAAVRRYLPDQTAEILAQWSPTGEFIPVGPRAQPVRGTVTATVRETRRPARVDRYTDDADAAAREIGVRSAVGVPITVEGELWGVIVVVSTGEEPPPPGTEERLVGFTELMAAAIANAQAREELRAIADEQAALRRVATLVATGAPPADVFAAVAEEVARLLSVESAFVVRYEPDDAVTILAGNSTSDRPLPIGLRTPIIAPSLGSVIRETGRPARIDHYADHPVALQYGVRSSAAAPITVQGRLWGYIGVTSGHEEPPPGTEARLAAFTEIAATAVANAESRAQLVASRARIVTAGDEERGRVVRDLHDGAQQRLVHAVITLKLARRALANSNANTSALLDDALQQAEEANLELRELAHGILPAALRKGGLRGGVDAVVSRMSLPVSVDVTDERLPASVVSTAYFIVSEALTNVAKHAHANSAEVTARVERGVLRVEIVDDGVGGMRRTGISGLSGLEDRVSALEGSFIVESPPGQGTRVCALLPLPDEN
jgi:signal transduction histidine kinase